MGLSHSPRIVTDGLVLYLDAANPRSYPGSGSSWNDLIGSSNGTITGGSYISDNLGALQFDSQSDGILYTPVLSASSYRTYIMWTNAVRGNDSYGYLLHNNSASQTTGQSYVTIGIDSFNRYYAALNGKFTTMFSDVTADNQNIVQLVLTWDGLFQRMYVNGIFKVGEALTTTPQNYSTTSAIFNAEALNYASRGVGNIYSFKVYNRALSQIEINQDFNALRGRYGL